MSTFRTPVGPQPANVYWRRRLLVGLGFVGVLIVILLIVFAPKGDAPKPTASSSPSATPKLPDGGSGGAVAACDPAVISVTAKTDAASYPEGVNPLLSMTITNNGAVDCTINAGTDVQLFSIVSGSDPIWNSRDCQTDSTPAEITLTSGQSISNDTPIIWDRTRSSTTTCDAQRKPVVAGGASYRLSVSLGDIASAEAVQFVLN